jgi:hypothetical protein
MDFDPLGVDIALCDTWFQLEAMYCNNTWWEAFQDDGSETSESGSLNVPSQPCAPVNWAGPVLQFPRDTLSGLSGPTTPNEWY